MLSKKTKEKHSHTLTHTKKEINKKNINLNTVKWID